MGAWRTRKVRGRLMSQERKKRNSLLLLLPAPAALVLLMPTAAAAMDGRGNGRRAEVGKRGARSGPAGEEVLFFFRGDTARRWRAGCLESSRGKGDERRSVVDGDGEDRGLVGWAGLICWARSVRTKVQWPRNGLG